ncbi:MAG TPA: BACON domain-containing carbohydrate-binding protein, partial [Thermodesulfobacteriota bacterium]|nr:BACON domain-containing carbohydrate-binding protein [Thermodesulfobacteriota bacterium]
LVTGGTSGSGSGTVNFTVSANTGTAPRTATMTIAGQSFKVDQQGAGCSYTLSSTTGFFSAGGGTGSIGVTSGAGCSWTATSNASWLLVTGASGSGNGTVNYTVAANTGAASRTATIGIAGQQVTIGQQGVTACDAYTSVGGYRVTSGGRQLSVPVYASGDCSWSASASDGWITFTSGAAGKGNGSIEFSVAPNPGSARTGAVKVGSSQVTINQEGGSAACTYTLSPDSQLFSAGAATGSVGVTAPSGCAWAAASNAAWITVTGGANGSGNGTVSFSVTGNTGGSRTGTIIIGGQPFRVDQQGGGSCGYTLSSTSGYVNSAGGPGSVGVTSGSGCSWTATSNAGWITLTGGTSGVGTGTVAYSVAANTGSSRSGTITIAGQSYTVTQQGVSTCQTYLTIGGYRVPYVGRQLSFPVSAMSDCSWSASSNVPWITILSGTGTGDGTVVLSVDLNPGPARTGTVSVGPNIFTISQLGP